MAFAYKQQCIIACHVYTSQLHEWRRIELAEEAQQRTGAETQAIPFKKTERAENHSEEEAGMCIQLLVPEKKHGITSISHIKFVLFFPICTHVY